MRCPVDTEVELVMSERQGVEIDYCPSCRGVWLDRGELDKILDRAADLGGAASGPEVPPTRSAAEPLPAYDQRGDRRRDEPRYEEPRYEGPRYGAPRYREPGYGEPAYGDHRSDQRHADERSRPGYKKKRKESWLGDLLDFG